MTFALVLAAGRGERMRPLTDSTPKPLLSAGGRSLIEHRIDALAAAGLTDIVINHAHLGEVIIETLGDGARYGVRIVYSVEPTGALETGGGILHALPLLKSDPFVVVNADIWTDYPFARLPRRIDGVAHLVLTDNPVHNAKGDFALEDHKVAIPAAGQPAFTFSGIGLYRRKMFDRLEPGRFPLAPLLRQAIAEGKVTGEHYPGQWIDVGTPERLAQLDKYLRSRPQSQQESDWSNGGKG